MITLPDGSRDAIKKAALGYILLADSFRRHSLVNRFHDYLPKNQDIR